MTDRTPLIAGNWKMNAGTHESIALVTAVAQAAADKTCDVVVSPPFVVIAQVVEAAGSKVEVAGQNLYPKDSGAYTGEISGPMLVAEPRRACRDDSGLVRSDVAHAHGSSSSM